MGLLTAEEEAAAIAIEFNPVRVGFHGAGDVWTRDVLNLGVRPDTLVQAVSQQVVVQRLVVFVAGVCGRAPCSTWVGVRPYTLVQAVSRDTCGDSCFTAACVDISASAAARASYGGCAFDKLENSASPLADARAPRGGGRRRV